MIKESKSEVALLEVHSVTQKQGVEGWFLDDEN
jgi:hypothetical protein